VKEEGRRVMIAAADTFRAAAVQQLKVWSDRAGAIFVSKDEGADAAAVAYEAYAKAKTDNADILIIDTAGRLQNKTNLMAELEKIIRVLKKHDETIPHAVLLVLDATTGQNAYSQVEVFTEITKVTGLVVTKLDGSAKGGVVVGLADRFGLPIHAVGVGEGINDLQAFDAHEFAKSLTGLV
jgi:fused signal recognition particle receptor